MRCVWWFPHKGNFWEVRGRLLKITFKTAHKLLRRSSIRSPYSGYCLSSSEVKGDFPHLLGRFLPFSGPRPEKKKSLSLYIYGHWPKICLQKCPPKLFSPRVSSKKRPTKKRKKTAPFLHFFGPLILFVIMYWPFTSRISVQVSPVLP